MDGMMMLKVMALGLGTVFAVLILLIVVINLINGIIGGKKEGLDIKPPVQEVRKTVKAAGPAKDIPREDEGLIAAITAAICASLQTSTHNFRVRSIRERKARWGRY